MAASMEPKLTPEDFKACRLEAIKAKALEIEKVIRFAARNDLTSVNSLDALFLMPRYNLSPLSWLDLNLSPLVSLGLYTAKSLILILRIKTCFKKTRKLKTSGTICH